MKPHDRKDGSSAFAPIFAQNTALPAEGSQRYLIRQDVSEDNEVSISVELWEGDPAGGFEDLENTRLDCLLFEFPPDNRPGRC